MKPAHRQSLRPQVMFWSLWLLLHHSALWAVDINMNISDTPESQAFARDAVTTPVPLLSIDNTPIVITITEGQYISSSNCASAPRYYWARVRNAQSMGTVVRNGQTYSVFASNIPGIGYTLDVADGPRGNPWLPIRSNEVVRTARTSGITFCGGASYRVRASFYRTSGQPPLNQQTYAISVFLPDMFFVTNSDNPNDTVIPGWQGGLNISGSIKVQPQSCSISGSPNQSIDLGTVGSGEFPSVGSTVQKNSNSATFTLSCPTQFPMTVRASVSDSNAPANLGSNILSLSADSTARGMGVQILRNGNPVKLGNDSSAQLPANDDSQWYVGNSVSQPSVTFTARYIRTGTVMPGSVKAQAGITFSYQ